MVQCPICGIERKSLYKHIRTHGYSCKDDFLLDYPGTAILDDDVVVTLRDSQLKRYEDPKEREKISNSSKKLWKNPEYREKSSKARVYGTKKQWENPDVRKRRSDSISKAQKALWEDPVYRTNQCQSFKDKWKNPDFRKKMFNSFSNIKEYVREQDGKLVKARSTYEVTCTWYLDSLGLNYLYEPGLYPYYDPVTEKLEKYQPDFLLTDLNLIIEVKSDYYYKRDTVSIEARLDAMRKDYGYKAVIVRDKALESIDNFVSSINGQLKKYGCADTLINLPQIGRS